VHRFLGNNRGTKDCVRTPLAAGITVYLIDSYKAVPHRLNEGDNRLE
jgi:hypothetical protein